MEQYEFSNIYSVIMGFPGGSVTKNPPAKQETQVQSLGQEDPLEKGMATHSSFAAWRIPWTEDPGGLQFIGSQRVGHDLMTKPPPPHSVISERLDGYLCVKEMVVICGFLPLREAVHG